MLAVFLLGEYLVLLLPGSCSPPGVLELWCLKWWSALAYGAGI